MAFYCDRADVLRALGGTNAQLAAVFGRSLWEATPATVVAVDGVNLTVPDQLLSRFDYQIEVSNSRVDASVLKAYQAKPTVVPAHLREATARFAAFAVVNTDGAKTDWLREEMKRAEQYMRDLAAGKIDLGIETPRPLMRKPAAMFVKRGAA
jgi:phage gp36-like protein